MLNFVAFKVNGFIDQPGVNLSQFQVINRLYSRAGGGEYFPQIPIWQVCFWSSKVRFWTLCPEHDRASYYFFTCELSLSRVSTFLQSLLLKQLGFGSSLVKEKFSRKIPLTMSMTRDTCWGNDTRYGCGLTMASFSQREIQVLRETSIIESNLSLFFYNKYYPLYEYKNTERVQSESKFTLDTVRRTETNSMRAYFISFKR